MTFFKRNISPAILEASKFFRVIVVSGPRQTGKTTLCRHLFPDYAYYNLEDIALRASISEDPKRFLAACGSNVIIDEAQNLPDFFSYIQLTVDNDHSRRFVLTGSNNLSLMENITQSLAGRAALFTLLPFALSETPEEYRNLPTDSILLKGLYPRVITEDIPSGLFYRNYYSTYVERDVRMIRQITDLTRFHHLLRLIAGRVGSECNMSALANETGISSPTVKSWISVLRSSYILTILTPYYTNISKRLSKSPKIYFTDTGLLCYLLGITTIDQLAIHPLRGAIFENLIVVEMLKNRFNMGLDSNLYFYRERSGREVDIIQTESLQLRLWEVKSSSTYNPEFRRNIDYLKSLLGDRISSAKVIYDGDTIPPDIINFRQIPD